MNKAKFIKRMDQLFDDIANDVTLYDKAKELNKILSTRVKHSQTEITYQKHMGKQSKIDIFE